MAEHKYDIFISYRRDGGVQYARILQLMLILRGYKVFLDYDELSDGTFTDRIIAAIKAQSILMSLWKVDDEATCLLMTEFYMNWIIGGMTKYDALELAKQTVRSHKEKGWDDPKCWVTFILLDALDYNKNIWIQNRLRNFVKTRRRSCLMRILAI